MGMPAGLLGSDAFGEPIAVERGVSNDEAIARALQDELMTLDVQERQFESLRRIQDLQERQFQQQGNRVQGNRAQGSRGQGHRASVRQQVPSRRARNLFEDDEANASEQEETCWTPWTCCAFG